MTSSKRLRYLPVFANLHWPGHVLYLPTTIISSSRLFSPTVSQGFAMSTTAKGLTSLSFIWDTDSIKELFAIGYFYPAPPDSQIKAHTYVQDANLRVAGRINGTIPYGHGIVAARLFGVYDSNITRWSSRCSLRRAADLDADILDKVDVNFNVRTACCHLGFSLRGCCVLPLSIGYPY